MPTTDIINNTNENNEEPNLRKWNEKMKICWGNVKKALDYTSDRMKAQVDKKRVHKTFKVGDKVYLSMRNIRIKFSNRKLGPKYIGPFLVTQVINPVTVRLLLPRWLGNIHPVFHVDLLKECCTPDEPCVTQIPVEHMEIDKILDCRETRNQTKYLVRWKGFPDSEASWVDVQDIRADELITQYHDTC
uniref:Chromo domain-containing protein n=1 Tax=Micrurus surinamensis TaxID=129470 RepID=A0A2D4Q1B5_MICSU